MSRCQQCTGRKVAMRATEGYFLRAARGAAANPSARNITALEKARKDRDSARQMYSEHLDGCHPETGEVA